MVGTFRAIWGLLTGRTIRSGEMKVMNGSTTVTLSLKRAKGDPFISLAVKAMGRTNFVVFGASEFDQFIRIAGDIRQSLADELKIPPSG